MKKFLFIIGLVVGLCLVAAFYFGFNQFSDKEIKIVDKEKTTKDDTSKKEEVESLKLTSKLVVDLASKANLINNRSTCSLTEKTTTLAGKDKWTAKDLPDEYKMFLAYRQVGIGNMKSYIYCLDYDDIDTTNGVCGDPIVQGNDSRNGVKNYTSTIDEKFMRDKYNEIFGEGTYSSVKYFSISDGLSYDMSHGINGMAYSKTHKEYVMTEGEGGGTCGPSPISKITTANKKGNKVFITERIISDEKQETKFDESFRYTFEKEDSTGNYIFKSIEKI